MVTHVGAPFVPMVADPHRWAAGVAKLRNSIAHRGGIATEDNFYTRALHYLGESVAYLTTACLLKELDLSAGIVHKLANHGRFKSVAEKAPESIAAVHSF
jgi:hypothetical protein